MSVEQRIDFEFDGKLGALVGTLQAKKLFGTIVEFFVDDLAPLEEPKTYPRVVRVGVQPHPLKKRHFNIKLSGRPLPSDIKEAQAELKKFEKFLQGATYGPVTGLQ